MFGRLVQFLKDARNEIAHVNWPTRAETIRLTSIVIALSLMLAVFLGLFDYLFSYLLKLVLLKAQ